MDFQQRSPARQSHSAEPQRSTLQGPFRACSQRCRARHKKCDIAIKKTACSPCQKAGAACSGGGHRTELRIRFSELTPGSSISASTSASAVTPETRSDSEPGSSIEDAPQTFSHSSGIDHGTPDDSTVPILPRQQPSQPGSTLGVLPSVPIEGFPVTPLAVDGRGSVDRSHRASNEHNLHEDLDQHTPLTRTSLHNDALQSLSRPDSVSLRIVKELCSTPWQLTVKEAKLVKHFISELLPWFDYLDPRAPFRSHIQKNMGDNRCILFAVLAVSARHLEAVGLGHHNSNEYERKSLEMLIPAIHGSIARPSHSEPISDCLFAMAVILRCLEEMTGPHDRGVISHTVCARILLQLKARKAEPSDLVNAAMAVAMRQELYIANILQRPMEIAGHHCGVDDSLDPAPGFMWALRITSHAVRVTNYVYGSDTRSKRDWDTLWQYLEEWDQKKPASFHPLNRVDNSTSAPLENSAASASTRITLAAGTFPEIYYMSDPPIAARQYLEICKILLLAHDPRSSSLGLGRTAALVAREESIRQSVRVVVGICLSNPEYTAARILAGLAVGMAGELFTDPAEIGELLRIVSQAESHIGWPGLKVSQRLRDFWAVNAPHME